MVQRPNRKVPIYGSASVGDNYSALDNTLQYKNINIIRHIK